MYKNHDYRYDVACWIRVLNAVIIVTSEHLNLSTIFVHVISH